MRRGSFFEEFGSIITGTLIALMVVVLFFVCFAFSRKGAEPAGTGSSGADVQTTQDGESHAAEPEETPSATPEETTGTADPDEGQGPADPEPAAVTKTSADGTVFAIVNETVYALDNVNMRTEPSTSGTVVAVLYRGNSVVRTGISDTGWSSVDYNGAEVYVSSQYVGTTAP